MGLSNARASIFKLELALKRDQPSWTAVTSGVNSRQMIISIKLILAITSGFAILALL
jgi:hypothetical protein